MARHASRRALLPAATGPALALLAGLVAGAGADAWPSATILLAASLIPLAGLPRRAVPFAVGLLVAIAGIGYVGGRARIAAIPPPADPAGATGRWVRGTVDGFPAAQEGGWTWMLRDAAVSEDGRRWEPVRGTVRVGGAVVEAPPPGADVVQGGVLRPLAPRRNFGSPSPEAGIGIRGEVGRIALEGSRLLTHRGGGPSVGEFLFRFRERSRRELLLLAGGRDGRVLAAVVLGMDEGLTREDRELFRRLGVSHLLAVSGLNLGLLFGLIRWAVLGAVMAAAPRAALHLRVDLVASAAAIPPVFAFLLLAGADPPVLRAFLSIAIGFLAAAAMRRCDGVAALALLAAGMAAAEPLLPFTASFTLTVAGTAGLVLFFRDGGRDRVRQAALLPFAAFIAVGPTSFGLFHSLPLLFYPANLLLAPLFGLLVIPASMAGLGLLPVARPAGMLLLALAEGIAGPTLDLMDLAARWGAAEVPIPGLPAAGCLAASLAIGLVFARRGSPWGRLACGGGILALAALLPLAALRRPGMEITFLDLPVGESILVRSGGRCFAVDTGGAVEGYDPGTAAILPELRAMGLGRAEGVVLTHPHGDHVGGAGSLVAAGTEVVVPLPLARDPGYPPPSVAGAGRVPVLAGDRLRLAGIPVRVLWPPAGAAAGAEANDLSVALSLEAGDVPVLLAGDLTGAALSDAVDGAVAGGLLKATHHGGGGSMPPGLLEGRRPDVVVVTGRPLSRALALWPEEARERGFRLLDTSAGGAVRVTVRGPGPARIERPRPVLRSPAAGRRGW